jgi:outer membrane immunogenic protein
MKRLLLTSAAVAALFAYGTGVQAADMAVKAPPPPYVPPQFNWTGFYIGGNVGGGAATGTVFDSIGASLGTVGGQASFIGGGQIGYNWQFSPNLVFGVDWFFDGISNNNGGGVTFISPVTGDTIAGSGKADWVTTITGRLGFTGPQADHWMFYVEGGGGWLQTETSFVDLGPTFPGFGGSVTRTTGGWEFGAGVEWAFAQNWTARFSYKYLGLDNVGVNNGLVHDVFSVQNPNFQSATVGINYLFNWGVPAGPGPVVSRY